MLVSSRPTAVTADLAGITTLLVSAPEGEDGIRERGEGGKGGGLICCGRNARGIGPLGYQLAPSTHALRHHNTTPTPSLKARRSTARPTASRASSTPPAPATSAPGCGLCCCRRQRRQHRHHPFPPCVSARLVSIAVATCLALTHKHTRQNTPPPTHTQTQTAFAFPFPSIFGVGGGGGLFDANKCSKVDAAELRRRVGTPQLLWSCGLVVDGATECLGAGLLFVLLCCFRRAHALALPLFI